MLFIVAKIMGHNEKQIRKYHAVEKIIKYNIKIVERGTIITFNTHIHERSLSLDICTAIKSGGVKLVLKA
jgi:histidinol phosphatase-like PHP family hydrolase